MAMLKQVLDDTDIDPMLKEMGCEAVTERVHGDGLVELRTGTKISESRASSRMSQRALELRGFPVF